MQRITNYINGSHTDPIADKWIEVIEPATGNAYAQAPASDATDVDQAVEAAQAAFPAWSSTPAADRSKLLLLLADLIERDIESLARAESIDTGKPISLARAVDIPRAAANFRFFATAILHSESAAHDSDGTAINYTLRKPRGVAGLISPWNLPLYLLSWKIAPAIATGNTCVAKPSEVTPMTAHMLASLITEAGFPKGVVNIVHGLGDPVGAAIINHPNIPTISFTGSTKVGRWIAATAGEKLKRVSLELGGKNPFIIFADSDIDHAVECAVRAAFTNQGQVCLCGSRILVERSKFQTVLDQVTQAASRFIPSDPLEESTTFGAITSAQHLQKIQVAVESARELGAQVHCGGEPVAPQSDRCTKGFFYPPTVLSGLDPTCDIEQQEVFGPVVSITPFDSEEQAIQLANGTPYGLASTIWTTNLSCAHRVSAALDSGIVWVNTWMLRDLRTPFGGTKQSGIGREGGLDALRFFTEPKNVCIKI